MKRIFHLIVLTGVASASFAQSSAKALFRDTTSGVNVFPPAATARPAAVRRPADPASRRGGIGAPVQPVPNTTQPAVTGLMYWIDLRTEKDELLRVDSSRTFHSGERIRIHVTSNVDGHLVIMQSQDGGPIQMLFPSGKTWDNKVQKFQDRTFPSENAWFKFDNKTGELRLLMMVTADPVSGGGELLASNAAPGGRTRGPTDPGAEAATANEIRMNIDKLHGSKALVVEEDKTDNTSPVNYVVNDSRRDNKVGGSVAVEIKLNHRS
jgi:hypothetical protein